MRGDRTKYLQSTNHLLGTNGSGGLAELFSNGDSGGRSGLDDDNLAGLHGFLDSLDVAVLHNGADTAGDSALTAGNTLGILKKETVDGEHWRTLLEGGVSQDVKTLYVTTVVECIRGPSCRHSRRPCNQRTGTYLW